MYSYWTESKSKENFPYIRLEKNIYNNELGASIIKLFRNIVTVRLVIFSPIYFYSLALSMCQRIFWMIPGAAKSLPRPGRKQAWKHVRDARDFKKHRDASCHQVKAPKEIHAIMTETLASFLPGRDKGLSAPLYFPSNISRTRWGTYLRCCSQEGRSS